MSSQRKLIFACIALILAGCTSHELQEDPRQSKFAPLLKEEYANAVMKLDRELSQNKDSLQALYFRATVEAEKGNTEDGIDRLTKLIEKHPNYSFAYSERSRANYIAGNYENAVADADLAIRYRPDVARNYTRRATAYLRLQQPEKALDDLQTATKLSPDEDRALTALLSGQAYMQQHQYEKAMASLSDSIKHSDKDYFYPYVYRSLCHAYLKDWQKASADCDTAQKMNPGDSSVKLLHAALLSATGKREQARTEYAALLKDKIDKRTIADIVNLGSDIPSAADFALACEKQGNDKLSKSVLTLVQAHRPLDPEELFALAKVEEAQNDLFRACKLLNECLACEPTWGEPRVELIHLYLKDNLPQKARDVQQEGLELELSSNDRKQVASAIR